MNTECGASIHAIFLLTVRRIQMFFLPKTFSIPRGIIPQNFRSLGFTVSEELGNIQTHSLTHWQTGALIERYLWISTKDISFRLNVMLFQIFKNQDSETKLIRNSNFLYKNVLVSGHFIWNSSYKKNKMTQKCENISI